MKTLVSGVWLASALAAGGLALGGCATEQYVDEHIATVNSHVDAVNGRVDQLNSQLGALSGKVNTVESTANQGLARANDAYTLAAGKFNYAAQGEPVSVYFDTGKWALSDEAKATLTELLGKLNGDNKNVYLEIVGHGDPRGATTANRDLGLRRAGEVRRFLSDNGVALNRMDPVSWGEEKSAKGRTKEDLAHDRRVDVIVKG